jgi:choline-sulfatase
VQTVLADPYELENLAGSPDHAEQRTHLCDLVESAWDLEDLADRVYQDQTARKLIDSALEIGRREPWDFNPRPHPYKQSYVRRGDAFPHVERRGYLPYTPQR